MTDKLKNSNGMKGIIISTIIAVSLIGGVVLLSRSSTVEIADGQNVSIVDGVQIVDISAKGGYQPRKSVAKAGIPTIVRFDTNGTFDCSSAVVIPSMNISQILPSSGTTDIDIGIQQVALFKGSCGMGMYPFEIDFRS